MCPASDAAVHVLRARMALNTTILARRCRRGRPPRHWTITAFVAGLRLTGITAPFVLDESISRIASCSALRMGVTNNATISTTTRSL